jgi:hypothetical protein
MPDMERVAEPVGAAETIGMDVARSYSREPVA